MTTPVATESPGATTVTAIDDATPVLNFANRPDFLADDTIQKFEAETGIKVNLTTYATDDEMLAGLRAGKAGARDPALRQSCRTVDGWRRAGPDPDLDGLGWT